MLKNELQLISRLITELEFVCKEAFTCNAFSKIDSVFSVKVENYCFEIRNEFTEVIFSDVPEHTLRRYFNFHLKGIADISDTLHKFKDEYGNQQVIERFNNELLFLIDFVRDTCGLYFNQALFAPVYFQERLGKFVYKTAQLILNELFVATIDDTLKNSIVAYLTEMSDTGPKRYSYSSLQYYQEFVNALSTICLTGNGTEKVLSTQLLKLNFNHLQFLVYLQKSVREKSILFTTIQQTLEFLCKEQQGADYLHHDDAPVCFPQWPSLKMMVGKWLLEEIVFFEKQVIREASTIVTLQKEKLYLDLPVAYIACLIKVFQEENVFGATSLSEVFRFVARNYRSKRQPVISVGGLSKEYYSVNQITAARVQDLLKKMVQQLSHNFFPLLVAVSSIGHVLKGMH